MKANSAKVFTSLVAAWSLLGAQAMAHHGAAVTYDLAVTQTVVGVVTDFQFVNPHVLVFLDVKGEDGTTTNWSAGLTSPNRLARTDGWSRTMLKPGDQITVIGNPAKTGAPSLWVNQIQTADGKDLLQTRYEN
jgi:hypothetical protein